MAARTAGGGPLYEDVDNNPNSIPMMHNEAYERELRLGQQEVEGL